MISPLTTQRRAYGNDVRGDVEHGPLKLPNDCTLTRVIDFFSAGRNTRVGGKRLLGATGESA